MQPGDCKASSRKSLTPRVTYGGIGLGIGPWVSMWLSEWLASNGAHKLLVFLDACEIGVSGIRGNRWADWADSPSGDAGVDFCCRRKRLRHFSRQCLVIWGVPILERFAADSSPDLEGWQPPTVQLSWQGKEPTRRMSRVDHRVHRYAFEGNFDALRDVLSKFPNRLNQVDGLLLRTPLHLACMKGRTEIVRFLLSSPKLRPCLDVCPVDSRGYMPVHYAALNGHVKIVSMLCRLRNVGVGLRTKDGVESTLLHLAARGGHAEVIRKLVRHGADFAAVDARGCTFRGIRSSAHAAASTAGVVDSLRSAMFDRVWPSVFEDGPVDQDASFGQLEEEEIARDRRRERKLRRLHSRVRKEVSPSLGPAIPSFILETLDIFALGDCDTRKLLAFHLSQFPRQRWTSVLSCPTRLDPLAALHASVLRLEKSDRNRWELLAVCVRRLALEEQQERLAAVKGRLASTSKTSKTEPKRVKEGDDEDMDAKDRDKDKAASKGKTTITTPTSATSGDFGMSIPLCVLQRMWGMDSRNALFATLRKLYDGHLVVSTSKSRKKPDFDDVLKYMRIRLHRSHVGYLTSLEPKYVDSLLSIVDANLAPYRALGAEIMRSYGGVETPFEEEFSFKELLCRQDCVEVFAEVLSMERGLVGLHVSLRKGVSRQDATGDVAPKKKQTKKRTQKKAKARKARNAGGGGGGPAPTLRMDAGTRSYDVTESSSKPSTPASATEGEEKDKDKDKEVHRVPFDPLMLPSLAIQKLTIRFALIVGASHHRSNSADVALVSQVLKEYGYDCTSLQDPSVDEFRQTLARVASFRKHAVRNYHFRTSFFFAWIGRVAEGSLSLCFSGRKCEVEVPLDDVLMCLEESDSRIDATNIVALLAEPLHGRGLCAGESVYLPHDAQFAVLVCPELDVAEGDLTAQTAAAAREKRSEAASTLASAIRKSDSIVQAFKEVRRTCPSSSFVSNLLSVERLSLLESESGPDAGPLQMAIPTNRHAIAMRLRRAVRTEQARVARRRKSILLSSPARRSQAQQKIQPTPIAAVCYLSHFSPPTMRDEFAKEACCDFLSTLGFIIGTFIWHVVPRECIGFTDTPPIQLRKKRILKEMMSLLASIKTDDLRSLGSEGLEISAGEQIVMDCLMHLDELECPDDDKEGWIASLASGEFITRVAVAVDFSGVDVLDLARVLKGIPGGSVMHPALRVLHKWLLLLVEVGLPRDREGYLPGMCSDDGVKRVLLEKIASRYHDNLQVDFRPAPAGDSNQALLDLDCIGLLESTMALLESSNLSCVTVFFAVLARDFLHRRLEELLQRCFVVVVCSPSEEDAVRAHFRTNGCYIRAAEEDRLLVCVADSLDIPAVNLNTHYDIPNTCDAEVQAPDGQDEDEDGLLLEATDGIVDSAAPCNAAAEACDFHPKLFVRHEVVDLLRKMRMAEAAAAAAAAAAAEKRALPSASTAPSASASGRQRNSSSRQSMASSGRMTPLNRRD